jgi:hypothetical protein
MQMRLTTWNPAEFTYWYQKADLGKRVRAWEDLTPRQRQLYCELDMFVRFARTAGIGYVPGTEATLDPDSSSPPPPDIVCRGEAGPLYFEMAEIVGEGWAQVAARAERKRAHVYGGAVDIWRPLLRIFSKKLRKRYDPQAVPVELVLHYGIGRQASFWPFVSAEVISRVLWIQSKVDRSPFQAVWLYDAHADVVLARFARGEEAFVR